MPSLNIKKSDIPLWTGADGTLALNVSGNPAQPLTPGANPVVDASFVVDGNQDIKFAQTGSVSLGISAGAHARIAPIFQENVGVGADLVQRFSLTNSLKPNNLLLAVEVGADAKLTAEGAFRYSVLSATATLQAGVDADYVAIRSFDRATTLTAMLKDLLGNLSLPAAITEPPAPGDLISFEYGGLLNFTVGASAGYELKGTKSIKVGEIMLSEHYALSVIGKLSLSGGIAGRFSVDVTAGSKPGFARVVVRRRRTKELQFAADVNVAASLDTQGLPASGKEFLGALLGVQGKNWLTMVDSLVTEAGEVDSIDNLKAKLDKLAVDYLGAFAGKAIDQFESHEEVQKFQATIAKVVDSYRKLDQRAVALFDRYFDPVLNHVQELTSKLDELNKLTSFDSLKGEVDPMLWNVLRQLTDGDPLGWALGLIPGTDTPSLPELKKRINSALSMIKDDAHDEIRKFIEIGKAQFKLDPLFNQLAQVTTTDGLKALANLKIGHFTERLIGSAIDKLNSKELKKAIDVVQKVVKGRDAFFNSFDKILKEAAAQSFTLDLHAAYASSSEREALIDIEIKLKEADGSANAAGLRLMHAAGCGDFQEALANFQPDIVRLNSGLLTHKVAAVTTLTFNVAGWHHNFHYEAMHGVIVNTEQQIRDAGNGLLTVFTTTDMTAKSERRKRGSKGEEAVLSNFLLRFLAETKVSDGSFDKATEQYVVDVITGMAALYDVTFTDDDTSAAELDDYLRLARQLDLDKVGATREALAPVLEFRNGSFGKIESEYEVRYTKAGLVKLSNATWTEDDIRQILRRIVLANYIGHKTLHDVGWYYTSDDVRKLVRDNGNNFINAGSILDGASVRFNSPIPGLHAPTQRSASTFIVRNDVFILFEIEDKLIRAFGELRAVLNSPGKIKVSELEGRLKSFGESLDAFDGFDEGENSVFAVVDALILQHTGADEARSSSLIFKSMKEGAERTKVFTTRAALAAGH